MDMAHLPNLIIVGVVAGRDLQCPRAKLSVHILVSNDGYQPARMQAYLGRITCWDEFFCWSDKGPQEP